MDESSKRGGHLPVDRKRAQEASDLGRSHLGGVALGVEEDVASDPRDVGLPGAGAVAASAEGRRPPSERTAYESVGFL